MFLEYTLEDFYWDENVPAQEINMNPYSLTFFVKTLLCKNSSVIFLSSFLNLFGDLPISTIDDPRNYSTCSNAMMIYILKMLEKRRIVKVIEYRLCERDAENVNIEKESKKSHNLKTYTAAFYKLRDLKKSDIDLIKRIANGLRVSNYQIRFKVKEGKIITTIGYLEILKSIFTGHLLIQLKRNFRYWQHDEGFKSDLDKVLYSLNGKKKSTITNK